MNCTVSFKGGSKKMDVSYITLVILIFVFMVYSYNHLISMRNMVTTSYSNFDTLLQRRFDLIPNLVSTIKGYMGHERDLLEAVTKARIYWMNASTIQENACGDNVAKKALKTIAVAENYPDLKTNKNFLLLQEELVGMENKIANIITGFFNFQTREFFEVESEKVREVPKVKIYDGEE